MIARIFVSLITTALLCASILYAVGVFAGAPLDNLNCALARGARVSWGWARHDDWGIEATFAAFQLFFITGLAALFRWSMKAKKNVQDTDDQVGAVASDAAASLATFLKSFDEAVASYSQEDPYLKDISEYDLKDQRNRAIDAMRTLIRKLELEIEIWRRVGDKTGNLVPFKEYSLNVLDALNQASSRNKLKTLQRDIQLYRKEFDNFIEYEFFMYRGEVPAWVADGPPKVSADYAAFLAASNDGTPYNRANDVEERQAEP